MTPLQHAKRMGMLMAAAGALLGWVVSHSEPTFADGLRYIQQAERIDPRRMEGGLLKGASTTRCTRWESP